MTFGKPIREWQQCRYCDWYVWHSALCRDHGNRIGGNEFRKGPDGKVEWRQGHPGPIVPAMRKG